MTLPQLFPSWYEFRNHIVRHFDKDNTEPTPFISFSGNLQWTIHRASRLDSPNDKGTCDDCEARIFVVNNNRSIKSSESPIGRCFQMRAAMEFINSLTEPGTKRAFEKGSMDWAQNADEWLVIGHVSDENIIARSSWNRLGSYTFLQNLTKFQYCFTLGIFRKFQSESQNFNSGRDVDKKEYRRLITEMCSTGYDVAKGQVLEDEEDEWEKKVQGWLIEEIEKYGWCYFVRA